MKTKDKLYAAAGAALVVIATWGIIHESGKSKSQQIDDRIRLLEKQGASSDSDQTELRVLREEKARRDNGL